MFKFPFSWLADDLKVKLDLEAVLDYLRLQGFEIASQEDIGDDTLIEIEVKANRPDMLSVSGVAREIQTFLSKKSVKEYASALKFEVGKPAPLAKKIVINSPSVHEYFAVEIEGINNAAALPAFVSDRLKKMGVEPINPVVDIGNYILLWLGQPIHIFDRDKIKGDIKIENATAPKKFKTLSGSDTEVPAGTLVISDEEKDLCIAGIIGGTDASVDKNTKNIIIEAANFDQVAVRTSSKKMRVSTLSSYRFERGVARQNAELAAHKTAELILDICGGKLNKNAFYYTDNKKQNAEQNLPVSRVNEVLGSNFSAKEAATLLNKCFFTTAVTGNNIKVTAPWWRLDIEQDVDIIEEIGRIYGYHNIEPQPIQLNVTERKNPINQSATKIRDIMTGFGFIECLNYGFIPAHSMDVLGVRSGDNYFGDITLKNPLSSLYALMRPTLAYSLIETAVNNLKRGTTDIKIFEIGKTFFRDPSHEDGYNEKNVVAGLIYGTKYPKGFGQGKEVKFSVFDITAALNGVLNELCTNASVKNSDKIKFLADGASAEVFSGDTAIGCVGMINPSVLKHFSANVIKGDMFYFEFDFGSLGDNKKIIKHESNYPVITREYNFLVKSGTYFSDYSSVFDHELIIKVRPVDVYMGLGVPKGYSSVLISVSYNSPKRTLESAEIDKIEQNFKDILKSKYDITLKI